MTASDGKRVITVPPIRMNSSVERRSVELIFAKKLFIPGKAGMKK